MGRRILPFAFVLVAALAAAEFALRAIVPVTLSTIGHTKAANARYYGWGYDPGDPIRLRDPDTGEVFVNRANNHGWRDVDRSFERPADTLRIVALGDSNTFGMIVPVEATWTRQLERLLSSEGVAAEVVNLSYAGWGTDQELEALRREGARYAPDIVVLQFTINDLTDNRSASPAAAVTKPFHYGIDERSRLVRYDGPLEPDSTSRSWATILKTFASRFEITKRVYLASQRLRFARRGRFSASETQRVQLRTVLGLAEDDCLLGRLASSATDSFGETEVSEWIEDCGRSEDREIVLRILENQPFKQYWSALQYDPPPLDKNTEDWRLFLGLLGEIDATADSIGADLVILSDHDEGLYEWERYWYRIGPGDSLRTRFFTPNDVLREFAVDHHAGFVVLDEKHERARNDSHPNRVGSLAMARNVLAYLKHENATELDAYRTR